MRGTEVARTFAPSIHQTNIASGNVCGANGKPHQDGEIIGIKHANGNRHSRLFWMTSTRSLNGLSMSAPLPTFLRWKQAPSSAASVGGDSLTVAGGINSEWFVFKTISSAEMFTVPCRPDQSEIHRRAAFDQVGLGGGIFRVSSAEVFIR